jgi:AhpD family alkylhydroperoxidase
VESNYPEYHAHLQKLVADLAKESPGPMAGFMQMHQKSVAAGMLLSSTKELIALAISIAVRCDGCIAYHVHDALEAGASREEIAETIGVAVMMGGGPAVIYGAQALEAVGQFAAAAP